MAALNQFTVGFLAIPSVNKHLVIQLARCEYVDRRENVIAVRDSGTDKTHVALGFGLAAIQRGLSVGFATAASLVHELIEARDERRLLTLQKRLARLKLLVINELGFVPLSKTGAKLLFEVFSQRYERGPVLVTTTPPFDEWTEVFGSERSRSPGPQASQRNARCRGGRRSSLEGANHTHLTGTQAPDEPEDSSSQRSLFPLPSFAGPPSQECSSVTMVHS